MALFKIFQGNSSNLPARTNNTIGYCYVTLDEHKMYIDANTERFALNAVKADRADVADKLSSGTVGNANSPIWFSGGTPQPCENNLNVNISGSSASCTGNAATATKLATARTLTVGATGKAFNGTANISWSLRDIGVIKYHDDVNDTSITSLDIVNTPSYIHTVSISGSEVATATKPAGIDNAWGIIHLHTHVGNYATQLGFGGTNGKMYFRNAYNSSSFGSWKTLLDNSQVGSAAYRGVRAASAVTHSNYGTNNTELPDMSFIAYWNGAYASSGASNLTYCKHGAFGTMATKSSSSYLALTGGTMSGTINSSFNTGTYLAGNQGKAIINSTASAGNYVMLAKMNSTNGYFTIGSYQGQFQLHYTAKTTVDAGTNSYTSRVQLLKEDGSSVFNKLYGAVWNDYAEYRSQEQEIEPGYIVISSKNGKVKKTSQRLSAFDGVVSDTFGFAIGETEECKTPLAVAGRVLVYCEGDRNDYEVGDAVCASENGKACKMTREEIREYPDRIVGTVSEIPEYETWGSGNVKVNNRIWIKVK